MHMLASQISAFICSYIVETENEVKNEDGNQRIRFGNMPMSMLMLYQSVLIRCLWLEIFTAVLCACQCWTVAYLLWLPHHPLSSLVSPVSNPAFRQGRTIFSASPSSMRMFSQSVPCISIDDRPPSLGSAIFSKWSVG